MRLDEIMITESMISDAKDRVVKMWKAFHDFFTDPSDLKKVIAHFDQRLKHLDQLKDTDRHAYYRELLKIEEDMRKVYGKASA